MPTFKSISAKSISDFQKKISNYKNFSATARTNPWYNRKIENLDDIKLASYELYKSPTIFRGANGSSCKKVQTPNVQEVLENLSKKIHKYFMSKDPVVKNQDDFDAFHNRLCETFMKDLNTNREQVHYDDISYGQAQKMINVLFKYLACYSDYIVHKDDFIYCHLPIDNNILKILAKKYNMTDIEGKKYKGDSWHEFDKEKYLDLLKDYRTAENDKQILNGRTFLGMEFDEWK